METPQTPDPGPPAAEVQPPRSPRVTYRHPWWPMYEMIPDGASSEFLLADPLDPGGEEEEKEEEKKPPVVRVNFPPDMDTSSRRGSRYCQSATAMRRRSRSMSAWSDISRSSWRLDERLGLIIFFMRIFNFIFVLFVFRGTCTVA